MHPHRADLRCRRLSHVNNRITCSPFPNWLQPELSSSDALRGLPSNARESPIASGNPRASTLRRSHSRRLLPLSPCWRQVCWHREALASSRYAVVYQRRSARDVDWDPERSIAPRIRAAFGQAEKSWRSRVGFRRPQPAPAGSSQPEKQEQRHPHYW